MEPERRAEIARNHEAQRRQALLYDSFNGVEPEMEVLRQQQEQLTGRLPSQARQQKLFTALMNEQSLTFGATSSVCGCRNGNLLGTAFGNHMIVTGSIADDYVSVSNSLVVYPRGVVRAPRKRGVSIISRSLEGKARSLTAKRNPEKAGMVLPASKFNPNNWTPVGREKSIGGPRVTTSDHCVRQYAGLPKKQPNDMNCSSAVQPVPSARVKEIIACVPRSCHVVEKTSTSLPAPKKRDIRLLGSKRKAQIEEWVDFQGDVWPDTGLSTTVAQDEANPTLYDSNPGAFEDQKRTRELKDLLTGRSSSRGAFRITRTRNISNRSMAPWPSNNLLSQLRQPADPEVLRLNLKESDIPRSTPPTV